MDAVNIPSEIWANIIKYVCDLNLIQICKLINHIIKNDLYDSLTYILEFVVPKISFDRLPYWVIRKMCDKMNPLLSSFSNTDMWNQYVFEQEKLDTGYGNLLTNRGIILVQKPSPSLSMEPTNLTLNLYELMKCDSHFAIELINTHLKIRKESRRRTQRIFIVDLMRYCAFMNNIIFFDTLSSHFNDFFGYENDIIECFIHHGNLEALKRVYFIEFVRDVDAILNMAVVTKSNEIFNHCLTHTDRLDPGEFYSSLIDAIEYDNFYAFCELLKVNKAKEKILKLNKGKFMKLERSSKCNDKFHLEFKNFMKLA